MKLSLLISDLDVLATRGPVEDVRVEGIAFDSRRVKPGYLFVAVPGTQVDGHDYIDAAIEKGCVAVVQQRELNDNRLIATVRVGDAARALSLLAVRWYDFPARDLRLVGVTGTNGKTTVATLLYQLFDALGYKSGLISTVGIRIGKLEQAATHTTPDALAINAALAEMRDAGVTYAFMEVSSHAVDQGRVHGLDFAGGIFTNLSHDHLDYHGSFSAYLKAKKAFFDGLGKDAFALTNADDRNGAVMVQNTAARVYRYSLRQKVDFHARLIEDSLEGLQLEIEGQEVFFLMVGRYNAYNLLTVYAAAKLLGQRGEEALTALSAFTGPAGRLERVADPAGRILALVDYAHTPDALANVLATLRGSLKRGRLLCVVGAGGDRDRTKRPEMARIAAREAEQVILTSDNPRSEDPAAILRDMENGLRPEDLPRVLTIADRRAAIRTAVRLAQSGDILLVAGKGHETYQEIAGVKHPFDDRVELANALKETTDAH